MEATLKRRTKRQEEPTVNVLFDLRGQVAIVTGACGNLGPALSRALAEAGATLVVTSRDARRAARFASTLPGEGHVGMELRLEETEEFQSFAHEVVRRVGHMDILVNNAYVGPAPSIDEAVAADFAESFHVGLTAWFLLARELVHHLRARKAPGAVINIASMYGIVASDPGLYKGMRNARTPPNYHALKGAVILLTRDLAVYWARDHVRVNSISPGPFPPDSVRSSMPAFVRRLARKVPLGRVGKPEELKGAVVLLASKAGSYITGQNLVVDGGWTAW
jgi:NAD(P)-dependent dehydrogenase (short-subunit alcohol dehydrogenase family)